MESVFERIRARTTPETRKKVAQEMNERIAIAKIVDEAYELYMPQQRDEIIDLTEFLYNHIRENELFLNLNILEIGTKYGGTLLIWCRLVEQMSIDTSKASIISVDMSDGGIHGGIADEDMDKRDLWFYERFPNVHFIRGNSHEKSTKIKVAEIIRNRRKISSGNIQDIDFLFLDGDHSYEGIKQDWELYSPFVKKGGIIALHDINDSERHRKRNVFVSKFWNEIKDDPKFESFEINANEDWAGIAVCIKK